MDDAVLAAIAHWPNVPQVYGWLQLDRRGGWRLKGELIGNPQITDFIGRNYEANEHGAWFFQNGPQRVYVQLDYTPWIARIGNQRSLVTHTDKAVAGLREGLLDEDGNLLLTFDLGIALVADRDLQAMLDAVVGADGETASEDVFSCLMAGEPQALWLIWGGARLPLSPIRSGGVAQRFGFIAKPAPAGK